MAEGELIDLAEDLGLEINERANVKEVRQQYAKELIANPVRILSQLPMEDLMIRKMIPSKYGESVTFWYNFLICLLLQK